MPNPSSRKTPCLETETLSTFSLVKKSLGLLKISISLQNYVTLKLCDVSWRVLHAIAILCMAKGAFASNFLSNV